MDTNSTLRWKKPIEEDYEREYESHMEYMNRRTREEQEKDNMHYLDSLSQGTTETEALKGNLEPDIGDMYYGEPKAIDEFIARTTDFGTRNIDMTTPATNGYSNPHAITEKMNKTEVLEHLKEKLADRGKDYGKVIDNHQRQADLINPYLTMLTGHTVKITPSQVANLMLLMKLARLVESPDHLDSIADIIGYGACAYEMVSEGDGK